MLLLMLYREEWSYQHNDAEIQLIYVVLLYYQLFLLITCLGVIHDHILLMLFFPFL